MTGLLRAAASISSSSPAGNHPHPAPPGRHFVRYRFCPLTSVLILSASSSASAFADQDAGPRAPCPVPTITAVGVASPSARAGDDQHRHAIDQRRRRSPPNHHHPAKVASAIATTVGTKIAAIRSARLLHRRLAALGLLDQPHDAGQQRFGTDAARRQHQHRHRRSTVAAKTLSPAPCCLVARSRRQASPRRRRFARQHLAIDRHRISGRSRKIMPPTTWATGTSTNWPRARSHAVSGCGRSSARWPSMCAPAPALSSLPSNTKVTMLAEASEIHTRDRGVRATPLPC